MNEKNLYDVIIIGGGPAGLTAGIYLARAKNRVLIVEKEHFGGLITSTHDLSNYPGVIDTSGEALTAEMKKQAAAFGAEFLLSEVQKLGLDEEVKTVRTAAGEFYAYGILLAIGAKPRTVGFQGEQKFQGRGVSYCATCDGEFFTNREVLVFGDTATAAEEAIALTAHASHVTIIAPSEHPEWDAQVRADIEKSSKITVRYHTTIAALDGEEMPKAATLKDTLSGESEAFAAQDGEGFGVFVFAGYTPPTQLTDGKLELDSKGYILTDGEQKTNIDGVYAAGDVCVKPLRQVVTAASDGATASVGLQKRVAALRRKTGVKPQRPVVEQSTQAAQAEGGGLFSAEMRTQLAGVFAKMEQKLVLELHLDASKAASELTAMMEELAGMTDKLQTKTVREEETGLPYVKILRESGAPLSIAFHGVPGGHEFNSFVVSLYNASGEGQPVADDLKAKIASIDTRRDIDIYVSLTCTMCPELVIAAQKMAALNANVSVQVYDLGCFPDLQKTLGIMSVPAYRVNDGALGFGKKSLSQLAEILTA